MAIGLRDSGHAVDVVSLTPGDPIDGIATHVVSRRWPVRYAGFNWHYLASFPRLRTTLGRLQPDVVYAQFVSSYGVLGALACPVHWPFVLAVQGRDLLVIARRSPLHKAAAQLALRRADLVLSPASHLTCEVHRLFPRAPVMTMQYGVDLQRFHPPGAGAARAPLVLSARALVPAKGVETVLRAARRLEKRRSALAVEVADDGMLRPALERDFRDLVASGRVRFSGILAEDELARRLRAAALYVSMAETDGTSMTLMEAMACGAFPIVADIPANRAWVEHGRTGFLVPCGDDSRLADLLEQAWADPNLRSRASEANLKVIRTRMDVRRNMVEIDAAFRRTAARRVS